MLPSVNPELIDNSATLGKQVVHTGDYAGWFVQLEIGCLCLCATLLPLTLVRCFYISINM